jgi:SPP1 family predicted phage head-tail adaptor
MNAGLMDEIVTVQQFSTTTDANTGEKIRSWSTYTTAWARVQEAESGSESVDSDRREHKQTVTFTMRHDAGINTKMRIVWEGKNYNIENIADLSRRMYLKIQTELVQ